MEIVSFCIGAAAGAFATSILVLWNTVRSLHESKYQIHSIERRLMELQDHHAIQMEELQHAIEQLTHKKTTNRQMAEQVSELLAKLEALSGLGADDA